MSVVQPASTLQTYDSVGHWTWYRTEPRSVAGSRLIAGWLTSLIAFFTRR